MTALHEKLKYFKDKQAEILAMEEDLKPKRQALNDEGNAKLQEVQGEYQKRMSELNAPLVAKAETYKAELKAFCGITDGEKTNVLEMLLAVAKVMEFQA